MNRCTWIIATASLLAAGALFADQPAPPPVDSAAVQFFESRIRPLLIDHCHQCHGAKKQQGGLRLDTAVGLHKGSDSGPVVVPGKPELSLLIKAVNHNGLKMPPKGKLQVDEISALVQWIKMGAVFPQPSGVVSDGIDIDRARKTYWAFQPLRKVVPPAVKDRSWVKNPIDQFILAALEAKGLTPVAAADRRTLIRRATYDLTGLPPTPDEIDAFLADDSPDAFAKVVDRLLASPHYGERWGRHWFDVVRYADTAGDNSDYPVPQMYLYRKWVIDAFNRDMPYDQFLREQLAGDLLPAADEMDRRGKLIATGYLANARRFGSYEDARYPWHLTIEDTIDNLGRTVLGLTVNCCRCHDHKFDPLTNEDYYALYGFFSSTRYPWPGIELDKVQRDLVPLAPAAEVERIAREREEKLRQFDAAIKKIEADKRATEQSLKEAEKLPNDEERLAQIAGLKQYIDDASKRLATAKKDRDAFAKTPLPYDTAYAVIDGRNEAKKRIGQVGNARVQIKGDPERPGKEVPRRLPLVLGGLSLSPEIKGSGRLQLADWLVSHPLTARVIVNRIWHWHMGRGIVATPSDFGNQGRPPTHPELLDYLARQFTTESWSIKFLHRLILLSATYQLAADDHDANLAIDINNDYLWRFSRRRLDAESIRDTLLAVSGTLDRSPGGPHPFPDPSTWNFTQHKPFKAVYDSHRRSVYLMTQRIQRHPYLAQFDGADTNASTASRTTSTTPLQALFLMNDPFVHDQARKFAARLLAERTDNLARIERAYLFLFGRPPAPGERAAAQDFLAQVEDRMQAVGASPEQRIIRAWESYVRVLFMTNELVYLN